MKHELIGRIVKLHGCEGAVTVKTERSISAKIQQMESLFLEIEGRMVPFFIEDIQPSGHSNLVIWLDGYDSVEKVKEFTGCRVFVSGDDLSGPGSNEEPDLTGFEIFTKKEGIIGRVSELTENNGQFLLKVVSSQKKVILIPLHNDLIVDVDEQAKRIEMSLPEGLITLNNVNAP